MSDHKEAHVHQSKCNICIVHREARSKYFIKTHVSYDRNALNTVEPILMDQESRIAISDEVETCSKNLYKTLHDALSNEN